MAEVSNARALMREPVCALLATRGREGLPMTEVVSALGCGAESVRAAVKYLYAHGRIGRRMEYYRLKVGNSVSHRQRRYRWFMCPEDDKGVHHDKVRQHCRTAGRRVDPLPAATLAE